MDALNRPGTGLSPGGNPIPDQRSGETFVEQPAALEHTRWHAGRRISGWQHGPRRDDFRRFHPDLLPPEALSEGSKHFSREIVLANFEAVADLLQPGPGL